MKKIENKDNILKLLWPNNDVPVLAVRGITEALYQKHDPAAIKAAERKSNGSTRCLSNASPWQVVSL